MCSCWWSAGRVLAGSWLNGQLLRVPTYADRATSSGVAPTDACFGIKVHKRKYYVYNKACVRRKFRLYEEYRETEDTKYSY